ncbi:MULTISPECIES: hypothetical protein [unclassified Sphingomonas]|uniref:hypothetical protein n=1 Tax=unclassified Sphingomonas TaxID=196159 RepID=UPI00226A76C2|nr:MULTISPECIES: hypothetical protein [unclassified Sphingomonas]
MVAPILHTIGAALLTGAGVTATVTIVGSVLPQWRRIARLACGHPDPARLPMASVHR